MGVRINYQASLGEIVARKSFVAKLASKVQGLLEFHYPGNHDQHDHAPTGTGLHIPSGVEIRAFGDQNSPYRSVQDLVDDQRVESVNNGEGYVKENLNRLEFIEKLVEGSAVVRNSDGSVLDPHNATPGGNRHVRYRIHQLGLEEELLGNDAEGLKRIIRDREPVDIIRPGETHGRNTSIVQKPQISHTYVYDTEEELGVGLKIGVHTDPKIRKPTTVMPYSEELEDIYRTYDSPTDFEAHKRATRITRAIGKHSVETHQRGNGIEPATSLYIVENGQIKPYNYLDEM